jgi:uncharacterized protein YgbK (DUF1537 family)
MTQAPTQRARVLFYGDDFTGASDNAAQYARHGLLTRLYFSNPGLEVLRQAALECDVVGVAGTARSLDTRAMTAELLPVLQDFAQLAVPFVQYKCCSTFDSSPHTGSLGHAIQLMRQVWPDSYVPVHAAAPEFGRYTVFGHHFARAGQQVFRLDRHPVMSVHPVTPMHEADLRMVLADQGFAVESQVDLRRLEQHLSRTDVLALSLHESSSAVWDGLTQQHVVTAAAALWQLSKAQQVCAMAAQGLAHGLGQFLREDGQIDNQAPLQQLAATDRLLVLSGSCSALSAAQIHHARECGFVCLRLGNDILLGQDEPGFALILQQAIDQLNAGHCVVVYTAEGPQDPHTAQLRAVTTGWSAGELAHRIGMRFAQLAGRAFRETPLNRCVVAGGDSSSFTMRSLGAEALQIKASHFGQNAHFASLVSSDPQINGREVLLKGGQVGTEQLYQLALNGFGHG